MKLVNVQLKEDLTNKYFKKQSSSCYCVTGGSIFIVTEASVL